MIKLDNKSYNKILIYDLETEGFWANNGYNRPIELGFLSVTNGNIRHFNNLLKRRPNAPPLKPIITEVTGITDEHLKDAMDLELAMKIMYNEIDDNTLIVGHNIVNFDNKFINFRFNKYYNTEIKLSDCFDTGGQFKASSMDMVKSPDETYGNFHSRVLKIMAKGIFWKLDFARDFYNMAEFWDRNNHIALIDVFYTTLVFLRQVSELKLMDESLIVEFEDEIANIHIDTSNRKLSVNEVEGF